MKGVNNTVPDALSRREYPPGEELSRRELETIHDLLTLRSVDDWIQDEFGTEPGLDVSWKLEKEELETWAEIPYAFEC